MPEIGEIRKAEELGYVGWGKYIWHACENCGKEQWKRLRRDKPITILCPSCAATRKGENHNRWKGGRKKIDGYILIWLSSNDFFYPMADKKGYVLEHRLIMARKLGRCLHSWELVHHKGIRFTGIENRSDNLEDNLEMTTKGSHAIEHSKGYRDGYAKGLQDGKEKRIKELEAINKELLDKIYAIPVQYRRGIQRR